MQPAGPGELILRKWPSGILLGCESGRHDLLLDGLDAGVIQTVDCVVIGYAVG